MRQLSQITHSTHLGKLSSSPNTDDPLPDSVEGSTEPLGVSVTPLCNLSLADLCQGAIALAICPWAPHLSAHRLRLQARSHLEASQGFCNSEAHRPLNVGSVKTGPFPSCTLLLPPCSQS